MLSRNEPRHIFMAISFGILVVSPVFLLLLPSFIANSLYQEPSTWVIVVPSKVYLLYGVGVLFLIIATSLLWILSVNKKSKWLAAICILISILFVAEGSGHYVRVSTEGISFKRGVVEANQHYAWDKIEQVVFRQIPQEGGFPKFDFYFRDGEMVTLPQNRHMHLFHNTLVKTLQREGIDVTRK
ncbi:hypothetical protein [Sporosarcina highlanderae]|uniref:Uncharacterized protein n=1 Tax=Sporosarcina highlanderae TaxID=3035916 RepID=A0ABT8JTJ6_9BACL|nr:hypothetical protein [Sporosarcina highlanderae]MDN4608470.1 hypothetical protein [Sporosarcina highlanderae]